jgi:hypothetical protein
MSMSFGSERTANPSLNTATNEHAFDFWPLKDFVYAFLLLRRGKPTTVNDTCCYLTLGSFRRKAFFPSYLFKFFQAVNGLKEFNITT